MNEKKPKQSQIETPNKTQAPFPVDEWSTEAEEQQTVAQSSAEGLAQGIPCG